MLEGSFYVIGRHWYNGSAMPSENGIQQIYLLDYTSISTVAVDCIFHSQYRRCCASTECFLFNLYINIWRVSIYYWSFGWRIQTNLREIIQDNREDIYNFFIFFDFWSRFNSTFVDNFPRIDRNQCGRWKATSIITVSFSHFQIILCVLRIIIWFVEHPLLFLASDYHSVWKMDWDTLTAMCCYILLHISCP